MHGTPKDLASARDLAERDKYQFQWWAVSMVDALPFGGKKKGADGGIDGIIYFKPDGKRTEKALVSVKGGGNVSVNMIRDLHSAMEREKAPIGVFITAALPTRPMETEAAAVERFESEATGRTYPRLQIITLAELFQGKKPDIPFVDQGKREAGEARGGAAGASDLKKLGADLPFPSATIAYIARGLELADTRPDRAWLIGLEAPEPSFYEQATILARQMGIGTLRELGVPCHDLKHIGNSPLFSRQRSFRQLSI